MKQAWYAITWVKILLHLAAWIIIFCLPYLLSSPYHQFRVCGIILFERLFPVSQVHLQEKVPYLCGIADDHFRRDYWNSRTVLFIIPTVEEIYFYPFGQF